MLMKIKDAMLTGIQEGLPVITTVLGGMLGSSRTNSVYKVGGYAGIGWLAGYLAQRGLFALLSPKPEIPEEMGQISSTYGGKAQVAGAMPQVSPPIAPDVKSSTPKPDVMNPQPPANPYGSTGFDPSSMGS